MRFHARFGIARWLLCALLGLCVAVAIHTRHQPGWLDLWCLFLLLVEILQWSRTCWEVRPEGLWVRSQWKGHTLPWERIQTVAEWKKFSSSGVLVTVPAQHPAWEPIRYRLSTGRGLELMEQIGQHAPQAKFEA